MGMGGKAVKAKTLGGPQTAGGKEIVLCGLGVTKTGPHSYEAPFSCQWDSFSEIAG